MLRNALICTVLLTGAAGPLAACACAEPAVASVAADIPVADLKTAIAAKSVVLIDANGSASFAKGRLPGALDWAAIKADPAKALPADRNALIVAYCGGPKCGAWKEAVGAIAKLGYTNVRHFSGGLQGWRDAGGQLEAAPQ